MPFADEGLRAGLRRAEAGMLLPALLVGAGAGLGAVAFRWLIEVVTLVLSGHDDYSSAGHADNPYVPWLGPYFVLLAPVVAGAIYGPLVYRYAKEARGHGVPEVMYAVARTGGRIPARVAVVKSVASALCIGGGGSVGREGPIVQIGSALGSTAGSILRMGEDRVRLLVACGAAGGIAATFNAPLAGVFFAMELILRDFTARGFAFVAVSSVTAAVIGRSVLGDERFLDLAPLGVEHLASYALYVLLGALAGIVGVVFTKVLYGVEDICDAVWRGPEWLRPAAGGILLGAILLALPEMYGVGYPVLGKAAVGGYAVGFLLVLLVGKIIACSVTIGIGGSGGVFAPSLFVGSMLGSAFGQTLDHAVPGLTGSATTYAVIGMGAVFAGSARAPITAVVIIYELTGEYGIILPLMAAVAIATGVSHVLSRDTVYTTKLRRRGVDLDLTGPAAVEVRTAMGPPPAELAPGTGLRAAVTAMIEVGAGRLPVVDGNGRYEGSVGALALSRALHEGRPEGEPIETVRDRPPALLAGQSLEEALPLLAASDGDGLPVLDEGGHHLLGWITHRSALAALHPPA
ncbi:MULTISPECIES: chloride channel protein [unclassified Streptomyces]|uniref:chloride channel protein n=1 Tax=unclassified Streptomyces TaxID=2593676 RepID=UPI000DC7E2D5|nr:MULTISPECIES: chloride channel protein [unclassified Streptomyces]AWZ05768.1 chloride channel protein [Streptomyces sp. ICC4]AWZ13490.1 chloride channel protein [Streptomyces sp. ICC1]